MISLKNISFCGILNLGIFSKGMIFVFNPEKAGNMYVCYFEDKPVGAVFVIANNIYTFYNIEQLSLKDIFKNMSINTIVEYLDTIAKTTGNRLDVDEKFHPICYSSKPLYDVSKSIFFNYSDYTCINQYDSVDEKKMIEDKFNSLMLYIYNTDFLDRFQIYNVFFDTGYMFSGVISLFFYSYIPFEDFRKNINLIKDWFKEKGAKMPKVSCLSKFVAKKSCTQIGVLLKLEDLDSCSGDDIIPEISQTFFSENHYCYYAKSNLLIATIKNPKKIFFDGDKFLYKEFDIDSFEGGLKRFYFYDGEFYDITLFCNRIQHSQVCYLKDELTRIMRGLDLIDEFYASETPIEKVGFYNKKVISVYQDYVAQNFSIPFLAQLQDTINKFLEKRKYELNLLGKYEFFYKIDENKVRIGIFSK